MEKKYRYNLFIPGIKVLIFIWFITHLISGQGLIAAEVLKQTEEKNNIPPHFLYTIPSEKIHLTKNLSRPSGVTSYKGDIYIADTFNNRIVALNELGEVLYTVGEKGSNPGQFVGPGALVADEDNLFVADRENCRIQVLDRRSGDFAYSIDFKEKEEKKGSGGEKQKVEKYSETLNPLDIELDTKGKLYVTFLRNSSVMVYDKKGEFKYKIGGPGTGDGEFAAPSSVSVNNFSPEVEVKIFAVDAMNARVEVFNQKGSFLYKFGKHSDEPDGFLMPTVISIDNKGQAYIFDRAKGKCLVFDKDGKFLFHFGRDEKLAYAEDIYIDSNNTIYIADTLNSRIVVYGY